MRQTNLWKAHGLGNDYLVWQGDTVLSADMVRRICHRNRGMGGDGILEPQHSVKADIGVRIWNPDASVAEKSGNGLRIFAWWCVVVQSKFADKTWFTVDTGTDVVRCFVDSEAAQVQVYMGRPYFLPSVIPSRELLWGYPLSMPDGTILQLYAVGVGNPHCMAFFEKDTDMDTLPWRQWGEYLENHALFPNRTNVQFAQIVDKENIIIRIWERGAGETSASGSSSCAVASVARKLQQIVDAVRIHMEGGVLYVHFVSTENSDWKEHGDMIVLQGPIEEVGYMEWIDRQSVT